MISPLEAAEHRQRKLELLFYLLREPFYSKYLKYYQKIFILIKVAVIRPILDKMLSPLNHFLLTKTIGGKLIRLLLLLFIYQCFLFRTAKSIPEAI